jgi:protein-S-isoprenylcysteine O-methyltransferase Ste14
MKNRREGSRGIIEIVVLLVVALVIIFLIGLEPADLWTRFLKPILEKSWEIIVAIAQAIAGAIKAAF